MTQADAANNPALNASVTSQIDAWRRQLLDTSKRNRLINCKLEPRVGVLPILHPPIQDLWELAAVKNRTLNFPLPSELLGRRTDPQAAGELGGEPDSQEPSGEPGEPGQQTIDPPVSDQNADRKKRALLDPTDLEELLRSGMLEVDDIATSLRDTALGNRLKRLDLAGKTSLSEQGVNCLFLAFGFVRWFESPDSQIEICSPLLLLPVGLNRKRADSAWELSPIDDELLPNHPLKELFHTSFNIEIPEPNEEALWESPDALVDYLLLVQAAIAHEDRWSVSHEAGLGTFAFQKISMWQDLRKNQAAVLEHPVCRGIGGDGAAMIGMPPLEPNTDLDKLIPLDKSHVILDCDSSQLGAVELVKQGRNLVLDGPPGTGKSQTIANIIAEAMAAGKKVLFVSEKAAALEVVKRRLDARRLGDFCLECHSHKANKRSVVEELGRVLELKPEAYPSLDEDLAQLLHTREKLTSYVRALHLVRSDMLMSAYEAHGRYAAVSQAPASRLTVTNPHRVTREKLRSLEQLTLAFADALNGLGCPTGAHQTHPWSAAKLQAQRLNLVDDIRFHFARAADKLALWQQPAESLIALGFLNEHPTLAQAWAAMDETTEVLTYPQIPASWANADAVQVAQAYIKLDAAARAFEEQLPAAARFKWPLIAGEDAAKLSGCAKESQELSQLIPGLPDDGAGQVGVLTDITRQAFELRETVRLLVQQTGQLRTAIGLGEDAGKGTSADAALALTRQAAAVASLTDGAGAGTGTWADGWFLPQSRAKMKRALTEAAQTAALAGQVRQNLAGKISALGFGKVAVPQINEVLAHDGWHLRLGGSWRRARRAAETLYLAKPTCWGGQIVDDMHELKRWHTLRGQIDEQLKEHADTLGYVGANDLPWQALIEKIDLISALHAEQAGLEGVKQKAAALSAQNKAEIASICGAISQTHTRIKEQTQRMASQIQLPLALGATGLFDAACGGLIDGLTGLIARMQKQVEAIKAGSSLLVEGAALSLSKLASEADTIQSLQSLKRQASGLFDFLAGTLDGTAKLTRPGDGEPTLGGWTEQAKLGTWIIKLADQHNGQVPARLLALLSDPQKRQQLEDALNVMNAALAEGLKESLGFADAILHLNGPVIDTKTLEQTTLTRLKSWLTERVNVSPRVNEWFSFAHAAQGMENAGLAALRDAVLTGVAPRDTAVDSLLRTFYQAWLEETYAQEPTLGRFDLHAHSQALEKFKRLDKAWIVNSYSRVRTKVMSTGMSQPGESGGGNLSGNVIAPESSEVGVLLREVNKKRRHMPLRKLFATIPGLLLRLKPCVMMSPLSVSTYLDSSDIRFDIVVFDEASQVRPHDAVCAIYRGSQLVVAGDQKQLPPTDFFERVTDDIESDIDAEDESINVKDFESILDICATLPITRQRLRWHYRSRRESLIAFSNRHFYDSQLVTFPSCHDVEGSSGVTMELVADGVWSGKSSGGINIPEAQAMARAVLRHARSNPDKSLGVITMNQAQQMRVIDEVDRLRRQSADTETFFASDRPEPFFVKNLENVQGDERDFIFLGVAYAKDEQGKLLHNFGPLNKQGGERRLNVAVTRARHALALYTSITAEDIDLRRAKSVGAKLLRAYLDFARRGPAALEAMAHADSVTGFESPFEMEVGRALKARGLDVRTQVGCSSFRIDLALVDPAQPGRYVLGIECDGATYHNSASARDRDRLRQEVLENLGWRICRVWSTDWARDPARQIEKVMAAYQAGLQAADTGPGTAVFKPADPEMIQPLEPPARPTLEQARDEAQAEGKLFATQPTGREGFESIDRVPDHVVDQTLLACVRQFGGMSLEDLRRAASRALGFQRVGQKIEERLNRHIAILVQTEKLRPGEDGRVYAGEAV